MPRKIDNSHAAFKVALRVRAVEALNKSRVNVLDAFHGYGHMWRAVRDALPDIEITVLGIDRRNIGPHVLRGDNVRIMRSIDLAAFDLIDLDDYGVPVKQLQVVSERARGIPLVITCIQQNLTKAHAPYVAARLPKEWAHYTPTFWNPRWPDLWQNYLESLGYLHWEHHEYHDHIGRKFYERVW